MINKELENKYKNKGYIFYIDLLGISYLSSKVEGNKIVSEKILKFHNIITYFNNNYLLQHSLSDSVFLYSNSDNLNCFFIVSNIFRKLIKNGVLCRAGCSYGTYDVLETKINENNLIGDTVSKAVNLEGIGKGHRIFISEEVVNNIKDKCKELDAFYQYNLITEYIDINYKKNYIFNWIFIKDQYCLLGDKVFVLIDNNFTIAKHRIKLNIIKNDIIKSDKIKSNRIKKYLIKSNRIKKYLIKSNKIKKFLIKINKIKRNIIKNDIIIKRNIIKNDMVENNKIKNDIIIKRNIIKNNIINNNIVKNNIIKNNIIEDNNIIKSYLSKFNSNKSIFIDYLEQADIKQADIKQYKDNPQIDITLSYIQTEEKNKYPDNTNESTNKLEGIPENGINNE